LLKSRELYPCELLFVHRDAETPELAPRAEEISAAAQEIALEIPFVRVIPIRMMEAWLLTDERAIRTAATNPNGTEHLDLPGIGQIEGIARPKLLLFELLREASGLGTHRKRTLRVHKLVHRIAELTDSFALLEGLPAFATFSEELRQRMMEAGLT
jgi:hypothetical protein